jgi:signal transduction histidine kinase
VIRVSTRRPAARLSGQLWPVLALLLLAVLLPTAALLWYMNQARQNEEAAVRLRLTEAYQAQLQSTAVSLQQQWRLREDALSRESAALTPPERFAALMRTGAYDGIVILGRTGRVAYPPVTSVLESGPRGDNEQWRQARKAEFETKDWAEAARVYEGIAQDTPDAHLSAQAWQGAARSLLKANQTTAALRILTEVLGTQRYQSALDEQGRWIAPNALLLALERLTDRSGQRWSTVADRLEARLLDYKSPTLPASQRRFVWKQLRALAPDRKVPPLLAAEELAYDVVLKGLPPRDRGLVTAGVAGTWALSSSDQTVVALLRDARLRQDLDGQLRQQASSSTRWELRSPAEATADADRTRLIRLTEPLRDWQLALHPTGPDPSSTAQALRLWTATLVLAAISLLTFVAGHRVSRQMQSTRLKDDLLATVSHELKTPLSSMRVLVDTLLAGDVKDTDQQREYLDIIARENHRLSGLIENFLTFSRMERGRQVFEFSRVSLPDVVQRAVASIGERVKTHGCRFEVSVEPDLPPVRADREALVTVLLNLVDNALKYSGADKHIIVRGYRRERVVCLEVEDNGIGFSRRVARRIFERFFQADRDAAGSAAGVGLGLSIVKYIVTAHDGRIDVVSQPGKGSRFTVCLPSAS